MFDYLITKIHEAPFRSKPFKHVHIDDFFSKEDFKAITCNSEITIKECFTDRELFSQLFQNNYQVISFPGCTTDYNEYISKRSKGESLKSHTACESAGIVLRLQPRTSILIALNEFLASEEFNSAIAAKFGIDFNSCNIDGGIQKYLDGYEISPHPDIRKKAATFMVNINPDKDSESRNHHTHYLKFKPDYSYIEDFWTENQDAERQWVPWEWCTTEFMQTTNNSIVLFSPSNNTMHGVKAEYDHLSTQRTQLYGNLWYSCDETLYTPSWEQLAVEDFRKPNRNISLLKNLFRPISEFGRSAVKRFTVNDPNIKDRGY